LFNPTLTITEQSIASEVEGMPPEKKQFGMQLLIHLTKENQNPIREAKRNFSRHLICFEGLLPWCNIPSHDDLFGLHPGNRKP
jgi:hypothetical protein